VGTGAEDGKDEGIEEADAHRVEKECEGNAKKEHGGDGMKCAVMDYMPVIHEHKTDRLEEEIGDFVEIRGVRNEEDNPRAVPAGVPEREHAGNNRDGCGVHEMLGKHASPDLRDSLKWFPPVT